MARYNSSSGNTTITQASTITSPYSGAFTEFTGTAPYTVTLPSPVTFPGSSQTFYNATAGSITLNTPSGIFGGLGASGTSSLVMLTNTVTSVTSDGTNYIVLSEDGSALVATTGSFTGNVDMSGAGATVTISPTNLTISPTGTASINNVNIGSGTRGSGAFTSLAANSTVSFTANTASSSTTTGTLVVTGGIGASGTVYAGGFNGPLTGTIQTASQTNITSLGTITSLSAGSISATSIITSTSTSTIALQGNGNNSTYTQTVIYSNQNNTSGDSANGIFIERGRITDSGSAEIRSFVIGSRGGQIQLILNKDGNLGIGNNNPTYKLDVAGTLRVNNNGSTNPTFYVDVGNINSVQTLFEHTGSNTPVPFALSKSGYTGSSKDFGILYLDMAHNTTGGGANMHFTLRDSANNRQEYAGLGGIITTNTSGSHGGALVMYTTNAGSTRNERVRISASGNVGIGNTDPQAALSFATAVGNKIDFYHNVSTSDRYGIQVQSDTLLIHSGTGGVASGGIVLGRSSTSTFTETMRVRNDGTVTIGNSTYSGGATTSNTYSYYSSTTAGSPGTPNVTRTNWGKSSAIESNFGRATPNYSMPFVIAFDTPNTASNAANTYYPVAFNTPTSGGGGFGNVCITRKYYDPGPAQFGGAAIGWPAGNSTDHQGGLEAFFHLAESAWSDYYSARLLYYRYTYDNTISDYGMMLTNDARFGSGPFWIRLRGGFRYWIHSSYPLAASNVTPGGTVFYYPAEGNVYQTWPGTTTSVQNTNFNSQQVWGTL
jgi:hypothetical protein